MSQDPTANSELSLPFEGMPASLGPGLRTASGARRNHQFLARRTTRNHRCLKKHLSEGRKPILLSRCQGISVRKWASSHNVPEKTAYRWGSDPVVRKAVESCRRRTMDGSVGQMTNLPMAAIEGAPDSTMSEEPARGTKTHLANCARTGNLRLQMGAGQQRAQNTALNWWLNPKSAKQSSFSPPDHGSGVGSDDQACHIGGPADKRLASNAVSEKVRLSACRALLADTMKASTYTGLESRVTEMEEQLSKRANAGHKA